MDNLYYCYFRNFNIFRSYKYYLRWAAERRCILYNQFVAIRWPGHPSGNMYTDCYTTWGSPNDVLLTSTSVSVKTLHNAKYPASRVVDGLSYCNSCDNYLSSDVLDNYAYVNLGRFVKVKKIIIISGRTTYFRRIYLYVGNSTSFASNNQVSYFGDGATSYGQYKVVLSTPVIGNYVHLRSNYLEYLELCEMQVIEA